MRRRRTAASLGALLLATLFAASPAPAAAWVDVYHSGTYYDQPNIYDEDGLPGVNCLFTDNAGTAHDWIDRIKVNQLNSHSPYHKKSYVGFRMVVGRNTPPLDDTAFTPYYTSPEVKKLATDETVAFFIAKHLRSNIRELEGALRKLIAYSKFHGREPTLEVAREALRDLLRVQTRAVSIENIQKTVADFYRVKVADLFSKKRTADLVKPRQIAMYFAKELTSLSLPEIGDSFGGRDHTTVLHAVRKIADARKNDSHLNHELHVLDQIIKG